MSEHNNTITTITHPCIRPAYMGVGHPPVLNTNTFVNIITTFITDPIHALRVSVTVDITRDDIARNLRSNFVLFSGARGFNVLIDFNAKHVRDPFEALPNSPNLRHVIEIYHVREVLSCSVYTLLPTAFRKRSLKAVFL